MPFKPAGELFEDILKSAEAIQAFVAGMTFQQYAADLKTQSAVERQFLVIAEAAKRLGPTGQELCPQQDWRALRSFGNIVRHDYDSVSHAEVWRSVETRLPALLLDVAAAQDKLRDQKPSS